MATYPIKLAGGLAVANKYGPDAFNGSTDNGYGAGILQSGSTEFGKGSGEGGYANQACVIFSFGTLAVGETIKCSLMRTDDDTDASSWEVIPTSAGSDPAYKESQTYTGDDDKCVIINLNGSELRKKFYAWRITRTGGTNTYCSVIHFTGDHRYGPGKDYDNPNVIEIIM